MPGPDVLAERNSHSAFSAIKTNPARRHCDALEAGGGHCLLCRDWE
jgi:hypothetical protein